LVKLSKPKGSNLKGFWANCSNWPRHTNLASDAVAIPTVFSAILANTSSMKTIEEIFGRIGSKPIDLTYAKEPSLEARMTKLQPLAPQSQAKFISPINPQIDIAQATLPFTDVSANLSANH